MVYYKIGVYLRGNIIYEMGFGLLINDTSKRRSLKLC